MSDQNSATLHQIRPDDLMAELSIKKDAYYAYLKHLSLKAEKDSEGKAYLTEDQANQVRALRSHVEETGKMEGFPNSNSSDMPDGSMVVASESSAIDAPTVPIDLIPDAPTPQQPNLDLDALIHAAAELKGHQLALPDLVKLELANRMDYEDLPEEVKQKVDRVREAAHPKTQPATLADQLLSRWRTQRQTQAQQAA